MQRLTGTFAESDASADTWHKVELPDRTSTYNPLNEKETSPPLSPEIASPGMESVFREEPFAEKEIYSDPAPEYNENQHEGQLKKTKKRLYWIIGIVAIIVVVLGVALGVGLGVGLNKK